LNPVRFRHTSCSIYRRNSFYAITTFDLGVKMKQKLLKAVIAMSAIVMVLMLADTGSAQMRREARGRRVNKAQVQAIINRVENRVDNFVRNYDRSLDRSRLNNSNREDWLNQRARDLETATDELSRSFNRRNNWNDSRDDVRRCLNIASDIDRNVRNYRFRPVTERNWRNVRFELNTLADVYNLPKVGAGAYR
jgi:hypothetical protein